MGIPGTQLQIFNNPEFGAVRRIEIDGKLYVVGIDVARALEYANPSKAILDHCKGVSKLGIPSEGGIQETNIIPIGDIYRLIVKAADQSKNPEIRTKAERFEKWIFDEVIPIVVETGKYEASPAFQDEHLRMMDKLIKENDASIMGKGDRAAFFRLLGNLAKASGGVSSRNQKSLLHPSENSHPNSEISPGDMLIKLLRHAEPMLTFQPRSEKELKSSVLRDDNFYYIFPGAIERYIGFSGARKGIYGEIKFLDGKYKTKRFSFFGKGSKNYHVWFLPRQTTSWMNEEHRKRNGNIIAFPGMG